MADFDIAYKKVMKYEGGYVDDPRDVGGETYKGIARNYNSKWPGWKIIDNTKDKSKLDENEELQVLVEEFYKTNYWDKFLGDLIPDQDIANELFDIAVNMGVYRANTFLQESLNLLNRNGKLYPDLVVDGLVGRKTIGALMEYLDHDDSSYLLKLLNILQGCHYVNFMKKSPEQEKFARGWLKRIEIKK